MNCPTCETPLPPDAAYCAQCGSPTTTQVIGETSAIPAGPSLSTSYEHAPERLRRVLGPNFELGRLIGRGGYAEVFAIRDHKLKRELAIKVLRPDLILTPALLERFRREALSVAALQHPAIVPVYDVGESDGICYILMPLIQGESLKAVLQRQRRLPIEEVQRIVLEAANALWVAHQANVVHRDIKPENIMLEGPDRHVRLMDFGIAKAIDTGDKALTGTGVVVGTPQYMSPEQASGEPNIDQRSDQYSLAVVAYQMLAGRAPFDGETARAIIAKQLLDQPPPLATLVEDLPLHIAAALHRAMQKSAKNRFDSIKDFAAALKNPAFIGPSAEPGPVPILPVRPTQWTPWIGAGLATILVVVVAMNQWRGPVPAPGSPTVIRDTVRINTPPEPGPAATTRTSPIGPPPPNQPRPDTSTSGANPSGVGISKPDSATGSVVAPPSCAALYERREFERAVPICEAEAKAGNVRSSRYAGQILADGSDPERAVPFFEQAARGNDAEAQFWMAKRLEASDPSGATKLYLDAANNNHRPAYPIIAQRFELGLGTARSEAKALDWYLRGGTNGDRASQLKLAAIYNRSSNRTIRSDSASRHWYEQAASGDNPSHEAEYRLALIYFQGQGVRRSDDEGLRWLKRAADGNHPEARKELDKRAR